MPAQLDENGVPCCLRPAKEEALESHFGRKSRIADFSAMRNGVPSKIPGDKGYGCVEFSPGYFTDGGGVLPGSNFGFAAATGRTIEDVARERAAQAAAGAGDVAGARWAADGATVSVVDKRYTVERLDRLKELGRELVKARRGEHILKPAQVLAKIKREKEGGVVRVPYGEKKARAEAAAAVASTASAPSTFDPETKRWVESDPFDSSSEEEEEKEEEEDPEEDPEEEAKAEAKV